MVEKRTLSQLFETVGMVPPSLADAVVSGIAYRSDAVRPGDVFFCIPGLRHDGHSFAGDALRQGAAAIVCEHEVAAAAPQIMVRDARLALAVVSARFFGEPSKSLDVVGITGTNGKTTTTYLLDSVMRAAGSTTGLIGTVETRIAGQRLPSDRTTPESADLQRLLAEMVDRGVSAVSMEVSSHAIDLHRVDAVQFKAVAFTNLTQDHLDYHRTLDEYWSVKRRLFTDMDVAERVVNIDDPYGAELAGALERVCTVGRSASAKVRAENVHLASDRTSFDLLTPEGSVGVVLPLAGEHNVSNALVAAGCASALGIDLASIARGLAEAPQVPGRLERIDEGQPFAVFVDYAHTPDGLRKAIATVRGITKGRVITVFGCGGDRDPAKRPVMGAIAGEGSDVVIVTSDNPRSEDPVGIIRQIEEGMERTQACKIIEPDRHAAIARAIRLAHRGDSVLIAGKGHEDYQLFADHTVHFDDREVAREELRASC